MGRRLSNEIDNICDGRQLVYHTDRPPLSAAHCRRAGPSTTADACIADNIAVNEPSCFCFWLRLFRLI